MTNMFNRLFQSYGLLEGRTVKITGNTAGHSFRMGTNVLIEDITYNQIKVRSSSGSRYTIFLEDFVIPEITKADLDKLAEKMAADMADITDQLDYLKETNTDKLDSQTYYKYRIHGILKSDMTDAQKEKKIFELIRPKI